MATALPSLGERGDCIVVVPEKLVCTVSPRFGLLQGKSRARRLFSNAVRFIIIFNKDAA
jgi:hypothetical protein